MKTREEVKRAIIAVKSFKSLSQGRDYEVKALYGGETIEVYRKSVDTTANIPFTEFYEVYSQLEVLNKTDDIAEVIGRKRYRSPMMAILFAAKLFSEDGNRIN